MVTRSVDRRCARTAVLPTTTEAVAGESITAGTGTGGTGLPVTGSNAGRLLPLAGFGLATGAFALVTSRRRRSRR